VLGGAGGAVVGGDVVVVGATVVVVGGTVVEGSAVTDVGNVRETTLGPLSVLPEHDMRTPLARIAIESAA
jgi:hypothetical protein